MTKFMNIDAGTHTTELKQLQIDQNDLRETEIRLETKSATLQHWLQLTYELELSNYHAKKAIAEQQLQAVKEECKKLCNKDNNFMGAFRITDGSSVDDLDSQIIKAKAALFDLTTDFQEILHRWKQIEMLCGFPIILNPGIACLENLLHRNVVNGITESTHAGAIIPVPLTSFSKSSPSFICKTSNVPNYSVPSVSMMVYTTEASQPPNLSPFKTDNEDFQIVKAKDDSNEGNVIPPSLSPCPQTSHTSFTVPDRYAAADIKRQSLRQRKLINYAENLYVIEPINEYEELVNEKKGKRSLDEPDSEYEKHTEEKKAKMSLDESKCDYEKEIEEKRAKNLEFLKSIGLDEAKSNFMDAVNSSKKKREKKSFEKSQVPTIKRTSERRKEAVYYTEDILIRSIHERRLQSAELTFKNVLKSDKFYEDFVNDFNGVRAEDCIVQTPVLYNKDILQHLSKKPDLWSSKIYSPSALTWYPSTENLVLAVGDISGNLGLWNIKESNYKPHIFSIHSKRITNLQFNPCNPFHLISSSSDGTLLCCDLQKQIVSEVLKISDNYGTYFDLYSPSSYLLSLTNGQIVIADRRCEGNSYRQRRYICHDSRISTINVHPVAKNYFVTAGSDRKICIWDLRKLTDSVVVNTYHRNPVCSAFFSPASGKLLLTTSHDHKVCVFNCRNMTEGHMELHKAMNHAYFNDSCRKRLLWLPNSDDTFVCSNKDLSTVFQIYDKDLNLYETIPDGTPGLKYLNTFHPFRAAFASVVSSGYIKVYA